MLAAAAEHERHMIGECTRLALAAAKARGGKLGNPKQARINRAKAAEQAQAKAKGVQIGGLRDYGREIKQAAVERAKALAPLFEELAGMPAREIARILNARKGATPTGRPGPL